MNLNQLIEGPSRIVNTFGATTEVLRVLPRVSREFRMVRVQVTPMTTTRKFLYPWRAAQVVESWDMTATLQLKDGRKYTCTKIVRLSHEKAMEMVSLEVVRAATIDNLKQVQRSLAM